jgi:glutamate--cysteine ligase catalytic subunit
MFPRLGASDSVSSISAGQANGVKQPEPQFPDDIVSQEGRYQAADKNIPNRREALRPPQLDKFKDIHTDNDCIMLEETIFGPGHCGLQVTFQAKDEEEARLLHDQLIPLGPILLSLTAATPIYKGYLASNDARWNQISQAVDDRSLEETESRERILHPRWYSNPMYLANSPSLREEFQFKGLALNNPIQELLEQEGLDPLIARHFAHVFVRDPIILAQEDVPVTPGIEAEIQDESHSNHFDSLNGTVWPHIRLKIPPSDNDRIGWRVEFRPMELQITDFENAAFCIFMALLRRVIVNYGLNFYMPLLDVQENMDIAHRPDAVKKEMFTFRRNFDGRQTAKTEPEFGKLTVNQIVNGDSGFSGLMPLVHKYLLENADEATRKALRPYLDLVSKRASGKLRTAASWMREFVLSHKDYDSDSAVSAEICYDLMATMRDISRGNGRNECGMF